MRNWAIRVKYSVRGFERIDMVAGRYEGNRSKAERLYAERIEVAIAVETVMDEE